MPEPKSDDRVKGTQKEKIDVQTTSNSTLQTLLRGILNGEEEDALALVHQMRTSKKLDDVATSVVKQETTKKDGK
jgi:hypothetical protein